MLGFSVPSFSGYNVVSVVHGHEGDEGIGTSVIQGGAEGARSVQEGLTNVGNM